MTMYSKEISVTAPVGQAIDRVKRMLFQPFDIGKWFIWYVLFQIVLAIAIGLLVLVVIVVTCCMAGCLMALPYVGTVVLLPVLVFGRSYSIYYLAQFGSAYTVFPAAP